MASFNPYNQYLNVQFETTNQNKLILMAYDGALRFCRSAETCMKENDRLGKGEWLAKAFETVSELRKSLRLDKGGDVAEHLNNAYAFISKQITMANLMNEAQYLNNAIVMLERMREAW